MGNKPRAERVSLGRTVAVPVPARAGYELRLPERSEIRVEASEGEELCVSKSADGTVTVWTRKKSRSLRDG